MSQLQKAIHRGLREAGLDVQMEYNEGLFSVDLALFLPPSRPGGDRRKVCQTPLFLLPARASLASTSAHACPCTGTRLAKQRPSVLVARYCAEDPVGSAGGH